MKVLEYWPISKLEPVGGPSGYLFYLSEGLKREKITDIEFLPKKKKVYSKNTKKLLMPFYFPYRIIKSLLFPKGNNEILNYDIVHFHSTDDLYENRKVLKNYKGIVLLTCHTPEPKYLEILHGTSMIEKILFCWAYCFLPHIDKSAFKLCDRLVFPCEEATEPYVKWKFLKKEILPENKIDYVISGSLCPEINITPEEIKSQLHIENDYIVCYVGRHNLIKGYTDLKDNAIEVLSKHKDVSFIICGSGPEKPLTDKKWIEIGWTKNANSYINASDVFVLPNRSTYFDLVLLEVLSLGKIVLVTETGGNKYFKKFNDAGIFFYHSRDEFVNIIEELKQMPKEKIKLLEKGNRDIFDNYFSVNVFARNYFYYYEKIVMKEQ